MCRRPRGAAWRLFRICGGKGRWPATRRPLRRAAFGRGAPRVAHGRMQRQADPMSDQVVVSRSDGVCEIQLNRPEKRNAITLAMYGALVDALNEVRADDG